MKEINKFTSEHNSRIMELLRELTELLELREAIDYEEYNPEFNSSVTTSILSSLNEDKEVEVKTLQSAWEKLEALIFNDLQITLQEKNLLFMYLGHKRKMEKHKDKSKVRSKSQVWRS